MGQAEEDDVEPVDDVGPAVERRQDEVGVGGGEGRVEVADALAGLGVGGGHDHVDVGVGGEQPQQFGPGEPRCPDDPGPSSSSHDHTIDRMFMQ